MPFFHLFNSENKANADSSLILPLLPHDVLFEIIKFLHLGSIANLALLSKDSNALFKDEHFLKKFFTDDFVNKMKYEYENISLCFLLFWSFSADRKFCDYADINAEFSHFKIIIKNIFSKLDLSEDCSDTSILEEQKLKYLKENTTLVYREPTYNKILNIFKGIDLKKNYNYIPSLNKYPFIEKKCLKKIFYSCL